MKWVDFENEIISMLEDSTVLLEDIEVDVYDRDGYRDAGRQFDTYNIAISYKSKSAEQYEERKKNYESELRQLKEKYDMYL